MRIRKRRWSCERPADLALLDRHTPPLGGVELFKRIRQCHAMPVVFLTASAEMVQKELLGTGLEPQGYIDVPYSFRRVVKQVEAVLAASKRA